MRGALFLVLVSLAGGCAQGEGTASDGAPAAAPAAPMAASVPLPAPDGDRTHALDERSAGLAQPLRQTCRKGAFCEDFEEAAPATRWTSSVAVAGSLDFVGPSSSFGARSLRASTSGPGSAAYLTLAGPVLATRWVGALGFSLRVDATPATSLGGPQLVVTDANGAATRVGFSVDPTGIKLDQRFDACAAAECAARSDLVAAGSSEWRRLVVAVETFDSTAPPYGRIEVTVDGGDLIVLPLVVTPFGGHAEIQAGITAPDDGPATLRVDDVLFFTR